MIVEVFIVIMICSVLLGYCIIVFLLGVSLFFTYRVWLEIELGRELYGGMIVRKMGFFMYGVYF